ncbi:MAG: hypothetical protein H7844_11105 [Nitrospirae bacterium YQR-1]
MKKFFKRILTIVSILTCIALLSQRDSALSAETGRVTVLLVKNRENRNVTLALEGFKSSCNCNISELTMRGAEAEDITKDAYNAGASAVLAIGDGISHTVKNISEFPVLYILDSSVESTPAVNNALYGIDMTLPAERQGEGVFNIFNEVKNIGIFYDADKESMVKKLQVYFKSRNVNVIEYKITAPADVTSALKALTGRIDLFWMIPAAGIYRKEMTEHIFTSLMERRIPVVTFSEKYLEMGAVLSVEAEPYDLGRQAGELLRTEILVDGAVKGRKFLPRKCGFVINSVVAERIGIKYNKTYLQQNHAIFKK